MALAALRDFHRPDATSAAVSTLADIPAAAVHWLLLQAIVVQSLQPCASAPALLSLQIWPRIELSQLVKVAPMSNPRLELGSEMPKYIEIPPIDLSGLDGEEFQVALRVALNDLRDHETVFEQFLNEAGRPDSSNWPRTVQYSHLHLLFAQTVVSTLLAESDRRIITPTILQPQIGAATTAALKFAQGREFHDRERIPLPHIPQRNHARVDHKHQIGFAIWGESIIRRRWVVNGEHVQPHCCLEPHHRWSRAVHWEFRAGKWLASYGLLHHAE